jgi:filamentous hemagglutinin
MSPGSLSGRQLKSEYSSSKIDRYRSKMKNGKFDWIRSPIDVAIVENRVIILDGHHRARAAGAALAQGVKSLEKIPVRIWTVSEETATRLAEQASEAMISFGK